MEIDFERMERVRQSASQGFGRTFTAAWDAISKIDAVPDVVSLVWTIPNISWTQHIVTRAIEPICAYKGYKTEVFNEKGRRSIKITDASGEVLGTITFSVYGDSDRDLRGGDSQKVDDYGEMALFLGRHHANR